MIFSGTSLFGMRFNAREKTVNCFEGIQKDGEVIYIIGETIQESFDEFMGTFSNLVKTCQFVEAKHELVKYFNDLKDKLGLNDDAPNYAKEDLRKLLKKLQGRSSFLLKEVDNNLPVLIYGCKDALRCLGISLAIITGYKGIITLDSGVVLVAILIAAIVCFEPILFFAISMIVGLMITIVDPNIKMNLGFVVLCGLCIGIKKVNDKWIEKNQQSKEIQKLLIGFEGLLTNKIFEN